MAENPPLDCLAILAGRETDMAAATVQTEDGVITAPQIRPERASGVTARGPLSLFRTSVPPNAEDVALTIRHMHRILA